MTTRTRNYLPADASFFRRFARPGDRVDLGDVGITDAAVDVLTPDEAAAAVRRHAIGDWSHCSLEDAAQNERALREGRALRSVHATASGRCFLVVTDAQRTATLVCLPED